MKHFIFVILLLLSVFVNAQMTMEEIAYIPSRSGYYNNLVVKGNVNINEIWTYPFDVISYGSLLRVNVDPSSLMYIGLISVSTGTVSLYSDFSVDNVSSWDITTPTNTRTAQSSSINLTMDGGNLSLSRSSGNSYLNINPISFETPLGKTPILTIRTENFNYKNTDTTSTIYPVTDNLYIFGMRIPDCRPGEYYWQPVKVDGTFYNILACNTTGCNNPEYEEACLQRNNSVNWTRYVWDTNDPNNCYCKDSTQGTQINILGPDDY